MAKRNPKDPYSSSDSYFPPQRPDYVPDNIAFPKAASAKKKKPVKPAGNWLTRNAISADDPVRTNRDSKKLTSSSQSFTPNQSSGSTQKKAARQNKKANDPVKKAAAPERKPPQKQTPRNQTFFKQESLKLSSKPASRKSAKPLETMQLYQPKPPQNLPTRHSKTEENSSWSFPNFAGSNEDSYYSPGYFQQNSGSRANLKQENARSKKKAGFQKASKTGKRTLSRKTPGTLNPSQTGKTAAAYSQPFQNAAPIKPQIKRAKNVTAFGTTPNYASNPAVLQTRRQRKKQKKLIQKQNQIQQRQAQKLEKQARQSALRKQQRQHHLNQQLLKKQNKVLQRQQALEQKQIQKNQKVLERQALKQAKKEQKKQAKLQKKQEIKALKQAVKAGQFKGMIPLTKGSSNAVILRVGAVLTICACLCLANVGYVMTTHKHLWSGHDVLDPAIASSIIEQPINALRGAITDRNGTTIAQEVPAYTLYVEFDQRSEEEKQKEEANNDKIRQQLLEQARENGTEEQVRAKLEAADAAYVSRYVLDPKETADLIASELDQVSTESLETIIDQAWNTGLAQSELGTGTRSIDKQTKEILESKKIPGLHFRETTTRSYPQTPFASSLIGFAQMDDEKGEITGRMGLEASLEEILKEEDGLETWRTDTQGNIIGEPVKVQKEKQDGKTVRLTLDSSLQKTVEEQMQVTIEENKAQSAWCLVMEVETGKILAWSSWPTYDQNTRLGSLDADAISMRPIEAGSILKPFVYAAAVDAGVFPYETTYTAGAFAYTSDENGKIIRISADQETPYPVIYDALGHDYGTLTFEEGLAYSSNIAICELLANHLNKDTWQKYLKRFQLDSTPQSAYIPAVNGTLNISDAPGYLSSGFGQGSSQTILEIAQAYTAIFNDGKMMTPYVVDAVLDPETQEVITQYEPVLAGQPLRKDTANQIKTMMEAVLQEGMSGERFAISNIPMSAKTGTGEIFDNEIHAYSTDLYTSSIIAAAPASDPKVMVCLGMQSPNYLDYSPKPFQTIMQAALIASHVAGTPDTAGNNTRTISKMPDLIHHSLDQAQKQLAGKNLQITILKGSDQNAKSSSESRQDSPNSSVIAQYPQPGSTLFSYDRVILLASSKEIEMPNLTGWNIRDVYAFIDMTGIEVDVKEEQNKVISQSIPAETIISVTKSKAA